jgi:glycosyltransferase involved in cell wall biosynthesis
MPALKVLAESLAAQTDQDFEWVVADGGSDDGTLAFLATLSGMRLQVFSEADRGVYDALNRAVKRCNGDYYLTVGSDDRLDPDAVGNYRQAALASGADFVCAGVRQGDVVVWPRQGSMWLNGGGARISHHSVGLLIKTALHAQHGLYALRYRALADQYFVKLALMGGASLFRADFVAGMFALGGVSSGNALFSYAELFDYQLKTKQSGCLQLLIFIIRIVRHFRLIVKQARD